MEDRNDGNTELVLGSAGKSHPGCVTMDIDPNHSPDVVHNMMNDPWPFEDGQFKIIRAHHVLEHLDNLDVCMKEMHRICASDGVIYIEVPHHTFWCAHDPYHKISFNYFSFDGFIVDNHTWQTGVKFECLSKQITFHKIYRAFFLHKLFNRFPKIYEQFWCFQFPAEHIKLQLRPYSQGR